MKKITITILTTLCAVIIFTSCSNKTDKKTATTTPSDTAKAADTKPPVTVEKGVKLVCKDLGTDSMDIPHSNILLSIDGVETKIKTINSCAEISKEEYKQMDIPDDAIMARGGWYAGAGDYYYIVNRNGKVSVFEGWQDETQKEKGYHWKEISVK